MLIEKPPDPLSVIVVPASNNTKSVAQKLIFELVLMLSLQPEPPMLIDFFTLLTYVVGLKLLQKVSAVLQSGTSCQSLK